MTTLGNYNRPTWGRIQEASGGMTQKAVLVTAPAAGQITRLGGWLAGTSGTNTADFAVWNYSSRAVLANTSTFSIAQDGGSPYGFRYEGDLPSPLIVTNGQQLLVGPCCTPGGNGFEYPVNASGSGTHYEKKVTTWPGSMSSMASQPYLAGFYAFFDAVEALGTLTVDTSAAPTVTFSWTATTRGDAVGYALAFCAQTTNPYQAAHTGNDPSALGDPCIAMPALGTTSIAVNMAGRLYPDNWAFRLQALSATGAIVAQTTYAILTINSPSPHPFGATQFWFTPTGYLQYTSSFKSWYRSTQWEINEPFATRFAGGTQVD